MKTYISTRSTLMPHSAVASSRMDCMAPAMLSLSLRISCSCLVPRMFLREVWASSLHTRYYRGRHEVTQRDKEA